MSAISSDGDPRPVTAGESGSTSSAAGTSNLITLILLRDRVRIPAWILAIAIFTVASAMVMPDIFPTEQARQARGALVENPAPKALIGPGYGTDNYTIGAMLANERLGIMGIATAIMSMRFVVRHTRLEEETGRTELLRANPLGRYASLLSSLAVTVAMNVVLGGLIAAGLVASGISDFTTGGSLLFGSALASIGIFTAAVTAVCVQLSEFARGVTGIVGGFIGVSYAFRAIGDIGIGFFSWLSPFGWVQSTKVFVDDRWWPLILPLVFSGGLIVLAFTLSTRRDVGASLFPPKPGSAEATRWLATPHGFAFRLQRSSLITWMISLPVFGLVFGQLSSEAETFLEESPTVAEFFASAGASITDSFLAMFVSLIAMICGIFAIQATMRIRSEETAGRADPLLSTCMDRWRYAGSHLVIALAGSSVIVLLASLALSLAAFISLGDSSLIGRLLIAGASYLAAVWFLIGITMALIGFLPEMSALAWAMLVYSILVILFGDLFDLPEWTERLTPFGYIPYMPAADFSLLSVAGVGAGTIILISAGVYGFQRRDIDMR